MSMRHWTAGGVAVASLATLTACSPQIGGDRPTTCAPPPAAITTNATEASTLRVVDSGFTPLGPNKTVVSIGAVLENTDDRVAYRTRIAFRVTGADGRSVVPESSGEFLVQEVPVILPKQKMPVGAWTYVEGQVSAIRVEAGPATFVPRDASFAEIATSFQSLARTGTDPETASVTFQMRSGYCRALTMRGMATVFRDARGKIIGGSFELAGDTCPAGVSTQRIMAQRSAPTGIDERTIEFSPYCDFTGPKAPKLSGGPVN
jgi:hypothetical protein